MEDYLFEEHRMDPLNYAVPIPGGMVKRTVSIRAGLSWPTAKDKAYYVVIAQVVDPGLEYAYETDKKKFEKKPPKLLVFKEGEASFLDEFFEKIAVVCGKTRLRVNDLVHGDEKGEQAFSFQLSDYLKERENKLAQLPSVWKSSLDRCRKLDFLMQLARNYQVNGNLIFFPSHRNEGHTPLLMDKMRNVEPGTKIVDVPELKALAHVVDSFDSSPWLPPPEPVKKVTSPWAM